MFTRKSPEKSGLEKAIDELHAEMQTHEGDSAEFDRLTDQLTKLYKLREHDAPKCRVSPDTLVIAGANLLGILIIVGYEQKSVMTSSAKNFLMKLR